MGITTSGQFPLGREIPLGVFPTGWDRSPFNGVVIGTSGPRLITDARPIYRGTGGYLLST